MSTRSHLLGGVGGFGQPWTWVDVHGMSMVGCHTMDMDATDQLSLLLCSLCCTQTRRDGTGRDGTIMDGTGGGGGGEGATHPPSY